MHYEAKLLWKLGISTQGLRLMSKMLSPLSHLLDFCCACRLGGFPRIYLFDRNQ